jgi:hypothetical protein
METKMSITNQPESAFPSTFKSLSPEEGQAHRWGMTLRDYFAAKAMQGLLANNNIDAQQIAKAAYIVADAMLKAREK